MRWRTTRSTAQLIKAYMVRHKVKPGITGWAQVNGQRGETDTIEKMQARVEYDLEYLRNWSLGLDLQIIVRTVRLRVLRPATRTETRIALRSDRRRPDERMPDEPQQGMPGSARAGRLDCGRSAWSLCRLGAAADRALHASDPNP